MQIWLYSTNWYLFSCSHLNQLIQTLIVEPITRFWCLKFLCLTIVSTTKGALTAITATSQALDWLLHRYNPELVISIFLHRTATIWLIGRWIMILGLVIGGERFTIEGWSLIIMFWLKMWLGGLVSLVTSISVFIHIFPLKLEHQSHSI